MSWDAGVIRHCGHLLLLTMFSYCHYIEEASRTSSKKLHQAYMNDLLQHGESNVLVTDEMGYLHEDTLEYIVFKVQQIFCDEMSKQSYMKTKLGSQSLNLDMQYVGNRAINECERHRAIAQFKYRVLQKLQQLYINIFLKQIPELRTNVQKEIYNIDYRMSKKLLLHMHWEFQDSFNAQISVLSKVVHSIIRKVVANIEVSWYKGNSNPPIRLQNLNIPPLKLIP